jgi:bacterioferritin
MKSSTRDHEGAREPQAGSKHAHQYPAPPPGSSLDDRELQKTRKSNAASGDSPAINENAARRERRDTAGVSRKALIDSLNEDLAREYQAIIAYVVYSQTLKGAAYMAIAKELEVHAAQELSHAITIAKHIDYLGGSPIVTPKAVKMVDDAAGMLRADLDNETQTIRAYRERLKQCEALEEFGIAEDLREILRQEQEHQVDLATALGEDVPR